MRSKAWKRLQRPLREWMRDNGMQDVPAYVIHFAPPHLAQAAEALAVHEILHGLTRRPAPVGILHAADITEPTAITKESIQRVWSAIGRSRQ